MKLIFFSICVSLCAAKGNSQSDFQNQFRLLIKDSDNGLTKYRGDFREVIAADSFFHSIVNLPETDSNTIAVNGIYFQYTADINNLVSEKKGKKIVDEFKDQLLGILIEKYELTTLKIVSWNPGIYGWRFKNDSLTVSITLFKNNSSKNYFIVIGVDNWDTKG